jgi:large conductance mechanosensitive channel
MNKMLEEFKQFAMKGNVMDLAIAVIIGAAFGKIVSSLVNDLLMPIIGMLFAINFTTLFVVVRNTVISYGAFLQAIVDFLIVAFTIFLVVKAMNAMKKKEEAKPAEPTAEIKLLTEIRDSLRK